MNRNEKSQYYPGKNFGRSFFVCTMATAINPYLLLNVSISRQAGINCSSCSFGTANVNTNELSKNALTAKGWFLSAENIGIMSDGGLV
ncbi:hypothetical protein [Chitinophaga filiformis]|uniref:hypothetical protein n=1 Tax=Chitinophaga filiformis TaxID=104663 RepID=UPI002936F00B|nr:hypothetical protein [Chitinophaga filiformis]